MRQRQELRLADRFALRLQPGAQSIGQRQIHIVAAEQDMLADADAVEVEDAVLLRDGDQAEVSGSAADIADQDDVAAADLSAPVLSSLRRPCVERRQGLLQQDDLAEAGGFRGLRRQISRNIVEGGGDGQHNLTVRQGYILASAAERMKKTLPDMFEIEARAVERGSFFFPDLRFPRQNPLPGIDMRVRKP